MTDVERLRALQETISAAPAALAKRNALLAKMHRRGWTHRRLAEVLSDADRAHGGAGLTEGAVQKAIKATER